MRNTIKFFRNQFFSVLFLTFVFSGLSVSALTLNEWNFASDPNGRTLSQAINVGSDGVSFTPGNEAALATDGTDALICTQDDPGANGMWINGAILDAALPATVSSGIRYLRYDFSYDMSDVNDLNNSGSAVGFAFYDDVGDEVAGVFFKYDAPVLVDSLYSESKLTDLESAGTIALIAKVDLDHQRMDVWYDLTGNVNGFSESSPTVANIAVSITSFDSLRFHCTGDIQPAGSTDQVNVDLLRTADDWASIVSAAPLALMRDNLNEWTFERDLAGTSLHQALNSGTNNPLAQFDAGFDSSISTKDYTLFCTGNEVATDGLWNNGAILNASIDSVSSGKHFLRYDVDYDFSSPDNDSGNVLGVYFTDATGNKAAGVVLGYLNDDLLGSSVPTGTTLISMTNDLPLRGTLTAIAEVDMDNNTIKVWYDFAGANVFDEALPAWTETGLTLGSLDNLTFHATGDFRPAGSGDFAAVDNIRHSATWSGIIQAPINDAAPPNLQISVISPVGMGLNGTQSVTVVISNEGGIALDVTSSLDYDGAPGDFTILSNNTPASLSFGGFLTNTYFLTGNTEGDFTFTAQAFSVETNSAPENFVLTVGAHLSYLSNVVSEVSGGVLAGRYEPGEVIDIEVFSLNDGGRTVSNIANTLSPDLSAFSAPTPAAGFYSSLQVNAVTSTTYQVTIAADASHGLHEFMVTNESGDALWEYPFELPVFSQAIPSVSPGSISLSALEGRSDTNVVTVINDGIIPLTFTITNDGIWDITYVTDSPGHSWHSAYTTIYLGGDSPETTGISEMIDFGFEFPLYGTSYSGFYVTADGVIGLSNSANAPALRNGGVALPKKTYSLIAPFWGNLRALDGEIRYSASEERVVVSFVGVDEIGGGDNLEFQTILFADGQIEFRYKEISEGSPASVTIGVQGNASNYMNLDIIPVSGMNVRLLPVADQWVGYTPFEMVRVLPGESVDVDFTIGPNSAGVWPKGGSSNNFNAVFNWSSGGSSSVAVSAQVLPSTHLSYVGYSVSEVSDGIFEGLYEPGETLDIIVTSMNDGETDISNATNTLLVDLAGFSAPIPASKVYSTIAVGAEVSTTYRVVVASDATHGTYEFGVRNEVGTLSWISEFSLDVFAKSIPEVSTDSIELRAIEGETDFETVIVRNTGTVSRTFTILDDDGWSLVSPSFSWHAAYTVIPMDGKTIGVNSQFIDFGFEFPFLGRSYSQFFVTYDGVIHFVGGAVIVPYWSALVDVEGEVRYSASEERVVVTFEGMDAGGDELVYQTILFTDGRIEFRYQTIPEDPPTDVLIGILAPAPYRTILDITPASGMNLRLAPYGDSWVGWEPRGGVTVRPGESVTVTFGMGKDRAGVWPLTGSTKNFTASFYWGDGAFSDLSVSAEVVPDSDGDGVPDYAEQIAGTDPQSANSVFSLTVQNRPADSLLSWDAPLDGLPRTYNVYYKISLTEPWILLDTVIGETEYSDTVHFNEPVIYYKMTVE